MGFQIFPEPSAAVEDTNSFGFFNNTNPDTRQAPNRFSLSTSLSIYSTTTNVPKGFYLARATNSATNGIAIFNGVNLTPSSTAQISIRVATDGTTLEMGVVSKFTRGGQSSYINISTGNITSWRAHQGTTSNVFIATVYTSGVPAYGNLAAISTNGTSWTQTFLGLSTSAGAAGLDSMVKNGEYFVYTNGSLRTSTDLVNWTSKSNLSLGNSGRVYYDTSTNLFYGVGAGALDKTYRTSTDAITWTTRDFPMAVSSAVYEIKRVNDFLFSWGFESGSRPIILVSTNGINWATTNTINSDALWSTSGNPYITDITFAYGQYFATARSTPGGRIISSTDGINWTTRYQQNLNLWSLLHDGTYTVAFGELSTTGGFIWTTNGTNWNAPGTNPIASATFGSLEANNFGLFAEYVPNNSTSKYYINGMRNSKYSTTTVFGTSQQESGSAQRSRYLSGDTSGVFELLVEKYNLSVDNTL